jgi:hypothetical protein
MIPIAQKTYLAEVKIPDINVGTQINFGFIAQLEGAEIYGIECLSEQDIGVSPSQNFPIDITGLPSLYVTFVVGEAENLYKIPCSDLNSFFNKGINRSYDKLKINFTKSYITVNSGTGLTAGYSICFNFIYTKK